MKRVAFLLALTLCAAPFAFGQTLTIGTNVTSPNGSDLPVSDTRTDISLDGATAGGTISSVTVYWSNSACANAFMIAAFRRAGDLLIPIGERGPFTTTSNLMTIQLTPPLAVEQGDLLGIVRIGNCGNPGTQTGVPTEGYLSYAGHVTANTTILDGTRSSSALALYGTGTATDSLGAILPAVGSVKGQFGSTFKTSLQVLNTSSSVMSGHLVFHQQGVAGSPLDPASSYTIPAGQQLTFDLGDLAFPSGLGSVDVFVNAGTATPQIVARVYNDAGTAGTAGFFEVPVAASDSTGRTISKGQTAYMVSPVDPARTRFNIGVRTLFDGAELTAQLLDNIGRVVTTVSKRYPANYFEQVDAASFFNGVAVGASKTIKITVNDGSAIVYGSITDNVTNDPSVEYAIVPGGTQ
jgi:hypothetical protein